MPSTPEKFNLTRAQRKLVQTIQSVGLTSRVEWKDVWDNHNDEGRRTVTVTADAPDQHDGHPCGAIGCDQVHRIVVKEGVTIKVVWHGEALALVDCYGIQGDPDGWSGLRSRATTLKDVLAGLVRWGES